MMAAGTHQVLDQKPLDALFEGKVQGLICVCYENERPLQGLCGLIDWRFSGKLSQYLRAGAFHGASGEVIYVPLQLRDKSYPILLVGGGRTHAPGKRNPVIPQAVEAGARGLAGLKLEHMGISRADFGQMDDAFFETHWKGQTLWITQ